MKAEELRILLRAQPFKPFVVHLPSGREVPIFHHDFAYLSPDGRTLWAYQKDYSLDMIDVMLIQNTSLGPPVENAPATGSNGAPNS
jgi:hypothetical protein